MSANADDLTALRHELALLKSEVSALKSRAEMQDLIVRYARACDLGNDPVSLRPLFTDDAVWGCKGFGAFEGGDQVALGLRAIAGEKIWWSLHNMISPQIDLDPSGEEATGFWYLWEAATLPNEHSGEAEAYWIGGTYEVRFRRIKDRWLFSKVELKLNMASPIAEGWVKKRFPDGTRSQPYFVDLDARAPYLWCRCGKSASQPFCDGSHRQSGFTPLAFSVASSGVQAVCGCRYSKTGALCDGSHLKLKLDPNQLAGAAAEELGASDGL